MVEDLRAVRRSHIQVRNLDHRRGGVGGGGERQGGNGRQGQGGEAGEGVAELGHLNSPNSSVGLCGPPMTKR